MDLISAAYAASPSTASNAQSSVSSLIMLAAFFAIFYFLLWRPQSKRAKEQRALLANLSVGDEVIAAGGIVGRINKVNDNYIVLSVANNIEITVQKGSVASVLPKGTMKTME